MTNGASGLPPTGPWRQERTQTALSVIDEMLVRLQELGDLARSARGDLPRHRGWPQPPRPLPVSEEITAAQEKLALTGRQREVLVLLAQGLSNRRIGRTLHIAEQTVKAHLHMIYRKLGVADRTGAVVVAMRRGLVSGGPVQVPLPRRPPDSGPAQAGRTDRAW
ncbi:response regulator transcription factor [Actinosynnema sp. NPDC023587]|uniref:response regulator transcription factor n=1 Tax=Actinosynnema sp. NPDC023587 TaxID=3154695 RepID=UPI0033F12F1C